MVLLLGFFFATLFLQESADVGEFALPLPATARTAAVEGLKVRKVPLDKIAGLISSGEYQPIPAHEFQRLQASSAGNSDNPDRPQIRAGEYQATLTGTRLTEGSLNLYLYQASEWVADGPLFLGLTSLRQLTIRDPQGEIPLGADIRRRLYVLKPALSGNLSGTWSADGFVAGEVVSFRLELPEATTSVLKLKTPVGISVTGAGALVLGPQESDGALNWTLFPSDPNRLVFSCRKVRGPLAQDALSLSSFSGGHLLNGDILSSRWTIGLSAEIEAGSLLTMRLSRGSRVSDVSMDDRRALEWDMESTATSQELRVRLPGNGTGGSLTVSAATVISQPETWELPTLVPQQWQRSAGEVRGPLLVPSGTITVTLPPSMNVDDWILKGMQERDVVTGPDQSRTFQLTQFMGDATAIVRTSTTQARLSDTLVTLLEPAGRLAAMRCFINLQCEDASVVEAKWQVARGWQVIAARYASNGRSLYFEMPAHTQEQPSVPLTVHLPETLEPGASRVIELLLQQNATVSTELLQLPVLPGERIERSESFLLYAPPSFSGSDFDRRWTRGRAVISQEEFRSRNAWFPESRLVPGLLCCLPGESQLPSRSPEASEGAGKTRILHTVRLAEGMVLEDTRVDLIAKSETDGINFLLPAQTGADVRWLVQDIPVTAEQLSEPGVPAVWNAFRIPLKEFPAGTAVTITCSSRRTAVDQWTAAIAFPGDQVEFQGTLEVPRANALAIHVENLAPDASYSGSRETLGWSLPSFPQPVLMRRLQRGGTEVSQAVDLRMFHLLVEREGAIEHRVMAVIDVTVGGGTSLLPVVIEKAIKPLVLVNGRRVRIQETSAGADIPLPEANVPCRIVLLWDEPELSPEQLEIQRPLPRLFGGADNHPVSVHHLLISGELQSSLLQMSCFSDQVGDVPMIPSPVIRGGNVDWDVIQNDGPGTSASDEVRAFAARWQLATTRGWRHQTIVDPEMRSPPVLLRLSSMRRHFAVTGGTALFCIGICLAGSAWILRHLQVAAIPVAILSVVSLTTLSPLAKATVEGAFWGGAAGILLLISVRGVSTYFRRFGTLGVYSTGLMVVVCLIPIELSAQDTVLPREDQESDQVPETAAVLIPSGKVTDDDVLFVRSKLLREMRVASESAIAARPSAVVTSVKSLIFADAAGSVELVMEIDVSAVSGNREVVLQLPVQGSRLVGCLVDGERVLPDPDGGDHILVPIPPSVEVSSRPLQSTESGNRIEASADEMAAFTTHRVECRLRPVTTRQASGVQFRIPGLPCPLVRVEISAAPGLYSTARIQTADGIQQWDPATGPVLLNGLATTEGADIRLLQAGLDKGSPNQATVDTMVISENTAGVQTLNCYCRFAKWNLLSPEVRYRIPQNYQLAGVSDAAGPESGDLLWSVQDQSAVISLPTGLPDEFVLLLQLRSVKPIPVGEQDIPVGELQQFSDCVSAPALLIASRTSAVFSPVLPDRNSAGLISLTEVAGKWGQWLRRSDGLYQVPAAIGQLTLKFEPRRSRHEVRMTQRCVIREKQVDWNCSMDVETSQLPVFRHRLTVPERVAISEVKVTAGEANRLASWHRRGDQLVILLREGTTGLHAISLTGLQELLPDESRIQLASPRVQDSQILESSMTLLDQNSQGLTFLDPGDAIPDPPINAGDLVQPGQEFRFQIVGESKPVVLQRLNPVDPGGSVAAYRTSDRIVFFARIAQWSASLGPLQMQFPEETRFLMEPVVMTDRELLPLVRQGSQLMAGPETVKQLFGVSDFTVVWSLPIPDGATGRSEGNLVFPWPKISDRLQWGEFLLVSGEDFRGKFSASDVTTIPEWMESVANRISLNISSSKNSALRLPEALQKTEGVGILIPVGTSVAASAGETVRDVAVVSLTTVMVSAGQSPLGQSDLVIFSSRFPDQCVLRIPEEILITGLPADGTFRWLDRERRRLAVDLKQPLTRVTLKWLAEKAAADFFSLQVKLKLPIAEGCEIRSIATIVSTLRETSSPQGPGVVLNAEEQASLLKSQLDAGLSEQVTDVSGTGELEALVGKTNALTKQLLDRSEEFMKQYEVSPGARRIRRHLPDDAPIVIAWRRRLELSTVIPVGIGLFVLVAATLSSAAYRRTSPVPFLVIAEGGPGVPIAGGDASAATKIMGAVEKLARNSNVSGASNSAAPDPGSQSQPS